MNDNLSSSAILYRFLILFFIFLMPFLLLFVQLVVVFLWKRRLYLISKISNEIHKYNNLLHSIGFVFNALIFLSAIIGLLTFTYFWQQHDWQIKYRVIWDFNNNISLKTFVSIIYIGLIFYIINNFIYLWYNLKKTDSFFAVFFYKKWIKYKMKKS